MKTSLVAAATLATVGRNLGEDKTRPVRLGIIGTGGRGSGLLENLFQFPGVEARAVCAPLPPTLTILHH